jgi:hypothetical protein
MPQSTRQVIAAQLPAHRGVVHETLSRSNAADSGWDVDLKPHHLVEWVEGSAVDPELAAANLDSLQGSDVFEVLLGEQLDRVGGHGQQFVTAEVRRLLSRLEPVAEAGGWWSSGLDPLNNWAPMAWGCFKPDAPRQFEKGPLKYENPHGVNTRSFWPRIPATVAARVADRFGLPLPPEVGADRNGNAGAFWRWWAREKRLPLLITEGNKKAAALMSGSSIPTVALPGIWNGCPKNDQGKPELLPDLAEALIKGRACWVLFDWSTSERGRRDVMLAARRLGGLLKKAGAAEVKVGTCPGPAKGADDHLAEGGTWEQLEAELQLLKPLPVLPLLRSADLVAPAGEYIGSACPLPSPAAAKLVALRAPMGSGKTVAIAAALARLSESEESERIPVVNLTHRVSLGTATADQFGLPWAEVDKHERKIALCIDSLCPGSKVRFRPADWVGSVVVIDEAAQLLQHLLIAEGTTVAKRRVQVLHNLAALLRHARQVVIADAQLSQTVLDVFERVCDTRALLISSEHKPAAGRQLVEHPSRDSWRLALVEHLKQRRRLWIATSAQQAGMANSAQNLAKLAEQHWPGVRVLVVDSDTMADPEHDAHRLALNPAAIAGAYDVVAATPAVAAGLSVTLQGHFEAVFGWSGGAIDASAAVQAVARVRDGCPRHLYVAEKSPGDSLRIGSGATHPRLLLDRMSKHAEAVAQMLQAGGWDPEFETTGPWLGAWAKLATQQNATRHAYRSTVLALLEAEGYVIEAAEQLSGQQQGQAKEIAADLKASASATQAAEDRKLIATELISDSDAEALREAKRSLSPAERAKLQRWRVAKAWALRDATPTPDVLEAHRDGLHRRLRFGWLLQNPAHLDALKETDRRNAYASARLRTGDESGRNVGELWAPDTCKRNEAARVLLARALKLDQWLQRRDAFIWHKDRSELCDPMLLELAQQAKRHRHQITQVLGVELADKPTAMLRQLLRLAGYQLTAKRRRVGLGRNAAAVYEYKVVPVTLPAGVDLAAMQRDWATYLGSHKPESENKAPEPGWVTNCRQLVAQGDKLRGFFGRLFEERYAKACTGGVYQKKPLVN